jgi:hypothetical protein
MGAAYEVTWNGAHNGRDDDLLHATRNTAKVYPVRAARATVTSVDQVLAALAGGRALTMREIVAATGLPLSAVNTSIYGLRGRIERTGAVRQSVYRLVAH